MFVIIEEIGGKRNFKEYYLDTVTLIFIKKKEFEKRKKEIFEYNNISCLFQVVFHSILILINFFFDQALYEIKT